MRKQRDQSGNHYDDDERASSRGGALVQRMSTVESAVHIPVMFSTEMSGHFRQTSVQPQVLIAFPGVNRSAVALVLLELGVAERVIQMIAEGCAHDGVGIELGDGLAQ